MGENDNWDENLKEVLLVIFRSTWFKVSFLLLVLGFLVYLDLHEGVIALVQGIIPLGGLGN